MKIPSLLLAVATLGDAKLKIHFTTLRLSSIKFLFRSVITRLAALASKFKTISSR